MMPYRQAWDYQEKLYSELMAKKLSGLKTFPGHLLFCEHPPVFTLGKSGSKENLLINEQMLAQRGIEFYRINRGGDITYHGPGQIVVYPIIRLADHKAAKLTFTQPRPGDMQPVDAKPPLSAIDIRPVMSAEDLQRGFAKMG